MTRALAILLALALSGCGFQLRGTAELPFATIFVPGATAGVALDIKRNIQSGTRTRVVDDVKSAEAVLQFLQETREKHILSLTGTGRVREFQLRYRVGFRLHDAKGGEFVPANTIELTRDVTYNDAQVLAKETEDQLLYRDMQFDMVQLVMRRLATAQRPRPQ
ncbi:MAG: LPS assembly lipoprotein LptE [Proteobacteria bacterium]|nr:LPS assembly lipoprotein LptE [Pseudomonadota bacterium]MDA0983085.1 LPS assembly lipoprotein LptE [Pseudomonadota bacterium]